VDAGGENAATETACSTNWLALGAVLLISFTVGAAAGLVFGHQMGKATDAQDVIEAQARASKAEHALGELTDAKTRAEAATQRQRSLEADLANASAEQARERGRLEAVIKERDQQLLASNEAAAKARAETKAAEKRLETFLAQARREAEHKKRVGAEKKKIASVPLTDDRRRKSEADAEYVNRKLRSTNRSILKGMTMLFGFNSLCDEDNVTKESIARVVGDDRDLLFTAGQMLVDVGSYIPPKSRKGLTLQESWDICMEALGVKK
jgi:hypothetical protein